MTGPRQQCVWVWLVAFLAFPYSNAVRVRGKGVEYIGVRNETSRIDNYFGIRYAEAPSGDLRWRPPVPISYAQNLCTTVINATVPGDGCLQGLTSWAESEGSTITETGYSEDCLLLNVQVPTEPISENPAVLVNIHGGGYVTGSAADNRGDSLVYHANGSMIYVAIQYRLGPWGFLAGDIIASDGTPNAGLLDQRAALEWVQENIGYFGGDPDKVTISGGSAGGGSVTMQLIMSRGNADVPFRAAVPEYPWWTPMYGNTWQNKQYNTFLRAGNCSDLSCLRALSTDQLLEAAREAYAVGYKERQYAYGTYYFGPVIDGDVIPEHPLTALRKLAFAKVPLLVDHDGYEGFTFTNLSITTAEDAMADLRTLWQDRKGFYVDVVRNEYPLYRYNTTILNGLAIIKQAQSYGLLGNLSAEFARTEAIFGDALVACPTRFLASSFDQAGLDVCKLIFNAGFQVHGAIQTYIYSEEINPDGAYTYEGVLASAGNATLASYLRDYLVSFVVDLDPNKYTYGAVSPPTWPLYHSSDSRVLYIQEDGIELIQDPDWSSNCKVLEMGRGNGRGIWPQW